MFFIVDQLFQKYIQRVMEEKNWKDWRPFIYGGLASIVAELGNNILYY